MTLYPEQTGATRSKLYLLAVVLPCNLHIHAGQGSLSTAVAIDFYTVEGGLIASTHARDAQKAPAISREFLGLWGKYALIQLVW